MKRIWLFAAVAAALALSVWISAALADSPGSDAAHICLQGPQRDYYEVLGATDSTPPLDYHGLVHGSDDGGTFILAQNHGNCVSFAADNTKKSDSKPAETITINFTKVQYENTGQ